PERNRIEFEIRKDREFLEEFVLKKNGTKDFDTLREIAQDKDNDVSVKNMAAAILEIHSWFDELLSEELDLQQYLKDFYAYLCTKVLIIYLSTPNNLDDAYNLFTVLNSRGLQLQASDILRAQNLRHIKDEGNRKECAEKWEKYESAIDEPFKSFDEFLWAIVFIVMKYRSDDNQSLNKAFEFMYGRKMLTKGEGTFELIGRYAKHLQAVTSNDICFSEVGNFFVNLNYILTKTYGNAYIAPLLHYRECFKEYRIHEFLIKLDNLCSVYWLTGKGNLQSRIFIILRKMEEIAKQDGNYKDLASQFLDSPVLRYEYQDEKASTSVDIGSFLDLLDNERWGEYAGQRINKTRYLLLKVDLLSSSLNSRLYFDSSTSSVEHLMPRVLGKSSTFSELDHKKWVHRLGNIVLVDRKKNSSLSNKEFPEKKAKYKGSMENRANTNYIFMSFNEWNIDNLRENHYRVLDLLKNYYLGNCFETVINLLS
ncbi:MAG: HNH endonuclease family protein, partial [Leptolyngbyaceae cyanobacterium bins.59]|nr:HNH endonuclease family protein [Leptolyngbyaceae cyanobacterium bins.59]